MFSFIHAIPYKTVTAYVILSVSSLAYAVFWVWGIIHAASTPKTPLRQRMYWSLSLLINPTAAAWYWFVWKRWAFWVLITPLVLAFLLLPIAVRTLFTKAEETFLTNLLFALGPIWLISLLAALLIFPLVLRLVALFHLGKNFELTAIDRNDWVISLSLPIFGLGAGMAYCAKYRRSWAIAGLIWCLAMAIILRAVGSNVLQALVPVGEEKREEFKTRIIDRSSENPYART